jgi:hypothetical protein
MNFEFVSYSTVGFGDMVPEDDLTVASSLILLLLYLFCSGCTSNL